MRTLALCALIAGFMVSCSPATQVLKSWKDPGASVSPTDTGKVFVIAMVKDETSRRTVEDELVKRLKGRGVPSYTVMPTDVLKKEDPKALEYELKSVGYSYIILMRLSNVENEVSYVPGTTS
ncbi:MAG TPA: hypothetical protein VKA49_06000, partial [Flavitalea sp.]|nr:hypothetical protein [Flavitalea sp.]